MTLFLSIIIIVVLLLVIPLISRTAKQPGIKFNKSVIISTYFILILLSTILYPFITRNMHTVDLSVYGEEWGDDVIELKRPENLDELSQTFEATFDYDNDTIQLEAHVDYLTTLFYEKTDELIDEIKVSYYTSENDNLPLNATYQNEPEVLLSGGDMLFIEDVYKEYRFTAFTKEFPITQFKGGSHWLSGSKISADLREEQSFLIQVPEHVQIVYEEDFYELVELQR